LEEKIGSAFSGPRLFRVEVETVNAFFRELVRTGLYKRTQGRVARQVTWVVLAVTMALGLYRMSGSLAGRVETVWRFGIPSVLLVVGLWVAYRVVNLPSFADFLIAVEAEMYKVSWPTRTELVRASIVVLITIFGLAALLALYDYVLWWALYLLGLKGE